MIGVGNGGMNGFATGTAWRIIPSCQGTVKAPEKHDQRQLKIGPDLEEQLRWILDHPQANLLNPPPNKNARCHANEI